MPHRFTAPIYALRYPPNCYHFFKGFLSYIVIGISTETQRRFGTYANIYYICKTFSSFIIIGLFCDKRLRDTCHTTHNMMMKKTDV